jgi:hypothetical protein
VLLSVIMVVVMTAIVSTVALVSGIGSEVSSLTYHRDQAFYAAEAGIQRAFYEVEYGGWSNPPWVSGAPVYPSYTCTVDNCSYTLTAKGGGFNSPVLVTSTGTYTPNSTIQSVITVTLQPKSTIPAIQLGNSVNESGNITVDGNTLVKGNIKLGGKVSINGLIQYGGTENNLPYATYNPNIPDPPQVWYDPTNSLTAPNNSISVNALMQVADASKFTDTTPSSLDFLKHSVLYIKVPTGQSLTLKNINVYGSGTLVVIGDVDIQNGVGDATDQVNIVATGNISTQGNFGIFGSIYAAGDLTHQGQFQVTGIISANGSFYATKSNNGAGGATITRAPPPAFDPRGGVGSGSTLIQNFTGPTL